MADFNLWIDDADADEVASELERIASMVRDGFTSGDTASAGWWSVKELAEHEQVHLTSRALAGARASARLTAPADPKQGEKPCSRSHRKAALTSTPRFSRVASAPLGYRSTRAARGATASLAAQLHPPLSKQPDAT